MDNVLGQRQLDCDQLTTAVQMINAQRTMVDPMSKHPLNTSRQFKGRITDDWSKWLSDFNKTSGACRWNEPRKLEILPSVLSDHAEKVYNQVINNLNAQQRTEWDTVTEALNAAFNTAEALRLKATQFHQCKQALGESSEAFADRLQDVYEQAYPTIPAADRGRMLLDAFINNLTPTLKPAVLCSNPCDLNTAVAAARRFEMQDTSSLLSTSALLAATMPSYTSLIGATNLAGVPAAAQNRDEKPKNKPTDEFQKQLQQITEQIQEIQKEIRRRSNNTPNNNNNTQGFNRN
ncbi:MAG: hypothetical protein GY696_25640, partial [Gammaproteobacteria bacterium]|nr:hypothetical protein [Gammaproteobacteria bacterium]